MLATFSNLLSISKKPCTSAEKELIDVLSKTKNHLNDLVELKKYRMDVNNMEDIRTFNQGSKSLRSSAPRN